MPGEYSQSASAGGIKVNMKMLAILCLVSLTFSIYIPPSSLPNITLPQTALPEIQNAAVSLPNFTLLAQRSVQGGYPHGLAAAKMTGDSKYDIVTYKTTYPSGGNTYLKELNISYSLYTYDGSTIGYIGASPPYNGGLKQLSLYHEANPSTGKLAVGGYYNPNTTSTEQYYGIAQYSSGKIGAPSKISLLFDTQVKQRTVQALTAGDAFGSSSQETLLIFKEYQPMKVSRSLLYTWWLTSRYQYEFPKFTSASLVVGNFYPATGNEIAVVGNGYNEKNWLYLMKFEGNSISKLSSRSLDVQAGQEASFFYPVAADLDSDGYDELILAGSQNKAGSSGSASTSLFHIYKYTIAGWALQNAYVFSDMENDSSVFAIGAADVDLDGKQEIVVANDYDQYIGGTTCHTPKVSMFKYEPSKTSPTLLSTSTIGSSSDCRTQHGAAMADFDGNGKKELAIALSGGYGDAVLAIYSLGYAAPANNTPLPGNFALPQAPIPKIGNAVEEEAPAVEVPTENEPEQQETSLPADEPAVAPETPPAPAPETPSTPPAAPSTDSAKAEQAVSGLQSSIASAKTQGADTSSAETYLAKAQSSLSSGDYAQASMNAARGETLVEAALARTSPSAPAPSAPGREQPGTQTPAAQPEAQASAPTAQPTAAPATDYMPYYVGVAALVILGVSYMFTHRPPAPARKK